MLRWLFGKESYGTVEPKEPWPHKEPDEWEHDWQRVKDAYPIHTTFTLLGHTLVVVGYQENGVFSKMICLHRDDGGQLCEMSWPRITWTFLLRHAEILTRSKSASGN